MPFFLFFLKTEIIKSLNYYINSELVDKANLWLIRNKNCKVINCETLSTPLKSKTSFFTPSKIEDDKNRINRLQYCLFKRLR